MLIQQQKIGPRRVIPLHAKTVDEALSSSSFNGSVLHLQRQISA